MLQNFGSIGQSTTDINIPMLKQNGRYFCKQYFLEWKQLIFLNENCRTLKQISLKYVSIGPIYNMSALVKTMAWHQAGDKALYAPMMS